MKPNSSKTAHSTIKTTKIFISQLHQRIGFYTVSHTYFSAKNRSTFNFIEVFTQDKPDTSAAIIQISTNHAAILPTRHICYVEVPITNDKPKYKEKNIYNSLVHNVAPIYHEDITELIPQTISAPQ